MTDPKLDHLLDRAAAAAGTGRRGPVVFLTGAGISAESGIPTFRGEEGYWQVGSRSYHAMELATRSAFDAMPDEVWGWYLYRRAVCRAARPNAAHAAVAALEARLADRFLLVTQNVDGLHLRAGSSPARTYQVHGHIDAMRCAAGCASDPVPIPDGVDLAWDKQRLPGPDEHALLRCPRCGSRSRPHVLWFDESYDEKHFRYESAIRAAEAAAALVVVGTSGATNLPTQMAALVAQRGAPMLVVDPQPTPFSELARRSGAGLHLPGSACAVVPDLTELIAARLAS